MTKLFIFLGLLTVTLGLSSQEAKAQSPTQLIVCESFGPDITHCEASAPVYSAQLRYQHSQSACVYGRNWGYDQSGVWVSQGCRGTFEVYFDNNGPLPPPNPVFCGRYATSLTVFPRAQAWVSFTCPAGCRLAGYANSGTRMSCNWNTGFQGATFTCFNPNPRFADTVAQALIDCVQ